MAVAALSPHMEERLPLDHFVRSQFKTAAHIPKEDPVHLNLFDKLDVLAGIKVPVTGGAS